VKQETQGTDQGHESDLLFEHLLLETQEETRASDEDEESEEDRDASHDRLVDDRNDLGAGVVQRDRLSSLALRLFFGDWESGEEDDENDEDKVYEDVEESASEQDGSLEVVVQQEEPECTDATERSNVHKSGELDKEERYRRR